MKRLEPVLGLWARILVALILTLGGASGAAAQDQDRVTTLEAMENAGLCEGEAVAYRLIVPEGVADGELGTPVDTVDGQRRVRVRKGTQTATVLVASADRTAVNSVPVTISGDLHLRIAPPMIFEVVGGALSLRTETDAYDAVREISLADTDDPAPGYGAFLRFESSTILPRWTGASEGSRQSMPQPPRLTLSLSEVQLTFTHRAGAQPDIESSVSLRSHVTFDRME